MIPAYPLGAVWGLMEGHAVPVRVAHEHNAVGGGGARQSPGAVLFGNGSF